MLPTEKNKITTRQLFVIFSLVVVSPTTRLFPQVCAELGGIAAWIAPILSAFAFFLLYHILNVFFNTKNCTNLSDVFDLTIGKAAGKVLLIVFLIWTCLLFFLYVRYYAERLLTTIFPNVNIRFFTTIILIISFIAARGKIESFTRFCEFAFLLFTLVFIIFYLVLIPTVKASNLLPVTYYDIWPAMKATYPILGIWGYITYLFFLGDHLLKKEQIKLQGKKAMIYHTIMATLLIIVVVGSLGYKLAERMPLPFFNAVKLTSLIPEFDRYEAILLSIYVISDFIIITAFMFIIMNIVKKLFQVSEVKYFASPLAFMGYAGSLFLATDRFQLEKFSSTLGLPLNIVTTFGIPIILFIVGKIRNRI